MRPFRAAIFLFLLVLLELALVVMLLFLLVAAPNLLVVTLPFLLVSVAPLVGLSGFTVALVALKRAVVLLFLLLKVGMLEAVRCHSAAVLLVQLEAVAMLLLNLAMLLSVLVL
jgi:hypothetical protein